MDTEATKNPPAQGLAPFVESTPGVESSDTLRARMDEEGYLFVRRLVDPAAVRHLRHEILAICARAGWLAPGTRPDEGIAAPGVRYVAGQPEFMRVYDEVQRLE